MPLFSQLFKGDKQLEECQLKDQAHLTPGCVGPHVAKVQSALAVIDALLIDSKECSTQTYGPSTAQAVLQYKTKRKIINHAYQSKPDNIVGKMTITSLDADILKFEMATRVANACSGKRKPFNV